MDSPGKEKTMLNLRYLKPMLLGIAILAGTVPAAIAAAPHAPILAPSSGTARVWFLRPSAPDSDMYGAAPEIYANGAPVGAIPASAKFYRDFAPGTYGFTAQGYGLPTNAVDTVQLAPDSVTYLEVQSVPAWEEGYVSGGGTDSHSFFVFTMSPPLAGMWLSALNDLGQGESSASPAIAGGPLEATAR
jgi:hypothetical protein